MPKRPDDASLSADVGATAESGERSTDCEPAASDHGRRYRQLREEARRRLENLSVEHSPVDLRDVRVLLEELHIHHIELEMQNEELVSTRERLEHSQKYVHELFTDAPVGYLVLAEDGRVIEANQAVCGLFDLPETILIGRRLSAFIPQAHLKTFRDAVQAALGGAVPPCIEVQLRVKADHDRWVRLDFRTVRHSETERFVLCSLVDVDEQMELRRHLEAEKRQQEEMNITLRNVMRSVGQEKEGFRATVSRKIETVVLPALDRIARERGEAVRQSYIALLRDQLAQLHSDIGGTGSELALKLSPTEMKIAQMIRSGLKSKEIAEAMNLSTGTVKVHRNSIRRKLGIKGKDVNLHSYLARLT